MDILDRHFPLKAIRGRRKPSLPWISKDIIDFRRQRDFCRKASISSRKSSEEKLIFVGLYRKLRNTITYRLRAAKSKFFTEKLCSYKSSPRLFWKSNNDITVRVGIASEQLPSVEALNKQFNSVVGTSSSNVPFVSCSVSSNTHACSTNVGSTFCNFPSFSAEEICSLLEHLNTNKASCSDGIDAVYLKLASKAIAPSLTGIFNRSLSEWKAARVTPVFKSGSRPDPANYLSVSLLPIVSKLLEKIVFEALNHHFESKSIFPHCQFGFRKARSTVDAVSLLENDLLAAKDRRLHSGDVFLDVRKAFDTVDHHLLLRKLSKEEVGGVVLRWFDSYLSGRRQFVKVGGKSSLSNPVVRVSRRVPNLDRCYLISPQLHSL